jgi:DNA-binding NtrC family response regulator
MHGGTSRTVPLARPGEYRIGRADECEIRIREDRVSRLHAVLTASDDGGWVSITDRHSENGTTVVEPEPGSGDAAGPAAERWLAPGEEVALAPGALVHVGSAVILVAEATAAAASVGMLAAAPGLVVSDPAMMRIHHLLMRIAPGRRPVLLHGERGVGKETLARRLHTLSPRAGRPFTAREGRALAELGRIGTLYVEELAELTPDDQAWLEAALRRHQVSVVAASVRDLAAEVAAGRVARSLYHLVGWIRVAIPALRERRAEIDPLARQFLAAAAARSGRSARGLSAEAVAALVRGPWPGNLSELREVIERAVARSSGVDIEASELQLRALTALPLPMATPARAPTSSDE